MAKYIKIVATQISLEYVDNYGDGARITQREKWEHIETLKFEFKVFSRNL